MCTSLFSCIQLPYCFLFIFLFLLFQTSKYIIFNEVLVLIKIKSINICDFKIIMYHVYFFQSHQQYNIITDKLV